MAQIEAYSAFDATIGSRLGRLPIVLLLTVGLLLSLIQCAACELNFSTSGEPVAAMSQENGSPPDSPEQMLLCHGGHCLSQVAHPASNASLSADFPASVHDIRQERFQLALASVKHFKPPRA